MAERAGGPGRFPTVFYVLTPLLAVTLTVVAAELLLALVAPTPFAAEHNLSYVSDEHTGYRHRPESYGRYARSDARINRHGHRDDETPRAKPEGTVRVLALGDSFTAGVNVAQDEPWPQVLERLLQDRFGPRIEVINAGVGGWNPFQYAQELEHHGVRFEPDLVIVGFFVGNDSYESHDTIEQQRTAFFGRRVRREAADSAGLDLKIWLYERSHLVRRWLNRNRMVWSELDLAIADEPRDGGTWSDNYLAIQRARFRRNQRAMAPELREGMRSAVAQLERIDRLADERGIPFWVLLIPDETQINRGLSARLLEEQIRAGRSADAFDLDMPQTLLHDMLEAADGVVDPLPAFRADPRRLYMNDTHWTPAGHRLAAERLAAALEPTIDAIVDDPLSSS